MNWWIFTVATGAAAALAACQGGGGQGSAGTRYVVVSERAPFYEQGPAQEYGPDFNLSKGQIVTMLDRGMGFSRVKSDTDRIGYVANEEIEVAPPMPAAEPPSRSSYSGPSTNYDPPTDSGVILDVPLPEEEPTPVTGFRY